MFPLPATSYVDMKRHGRVYVTLCGGRGNVLGIITTELLISFLTLSIQQVIPEKIKRCVNWFWNMSQLGEHEEEPEMSIRTVWECDEVENPQHPAGRMRSWTQLVFQMFGWSSDFTMSCHVMSYLIPLLEPTTTPCSSVHSVLRNTRTTYRHV